MKYCQDHRRVYLGPFMTPSILRQSPIEWVYVDNIAIVSLLRGYIWVDDFEL